MANGGNDAQGFIEGMDSFFAIITAILPAIIGVVTVVAIAATAMMIYEQRRKHIPLAKALEGVVDLNATLEGVKYLDQGFDHALNAAIHKKAVFDYQSRFEMTTDMYGDPRPEFLEHERKLHIQYYNMIFQHYETQGAFGRVKKVYFANPEFLEWLKMQSKQYQTQDFVNAVVTYMHYIECEIRETFGDVENVYVNEDGYVVDEKGNRLESIQEKKERLEKEDAETQEDIMKSYQEVKTKKDIDSSRKKVVDRYQQCINEIKANGGRGLMPEKPQSIPVALYQMLYSLKVYGDQQINRMMSDSRWDTLSETGCYIIYNTYNGKSYVGMSDNIYSAIKSYLNGKMSDNNDAFRKDIAAGHKVLVKMVPLHNSGYADINHLYEALSRAYKVQSSAGYNTAANLV